MGGTIADVQNLRIYVPEARSADVVEMLESNPWVSSLAVMRGASLQPKGDLILADVAREVTNEVIEELRAMDIHREGSIHLTPIPTWLSQSAYEAERDAPGDPADAVVWADVIQTAYDDTALSWTFVSMLTLAVVIAEVAILLDSSILLVGAMVVGPEFGAVAALGLALVTRRRNLFSRALETLMVGFAVALLVGTVVAVGFHLAGWASAEDLLKPRPRTGFIYHPDKWSLFIAIVAGMVGVIAMTSQRSGALVGVFISVTTVPAAGNAALAIGLTEWGELAGSMAQLVINIVGMAVAGWLTLLYQGFVWEKIISVQSKRRVRAKARDKSPEPYRDPGGML